MLEIEQVELASEITSIRERVVISPATGTFHPRPPDVFTTEGEWVDEGQVVAEIRNGDEVWPVTCAFRGWLMGMLAIPGQPVRSGDRLFWIRP